MGTGLAAFMEQAGGQRGPSLRRASRMGQSSGEGAIMVKALDCALSEPRRHWRMVRSDTISVLERC